MRNKFKGCQNPKDAKELAMKLRKTIKDHSVFGETYYTDIEIVLDMLKKENAKESEKQRRYSDYVIKNCI